MSFVWIPSPIRPWEGGRSTAPDVFVPLDTTGFPASFRELVYAGRLREQAFRLASERRAEWLAYPDVAAFLDAVDDGLDLGVGALIDETYLPDEDRDRSMVLSRRRLAERIAHNVWGESAGHRAALRGDAEWVEAVATFGRLDALLEPSEED